MVKGTVRVTSGVDHMDDLRKQIAALAKKEVLVGITEENSTRETSSEINNAELLYIQSHGVRQTEMRQEMQKNIDGGMKYSAAHSLYVQEHGSPLWHVPPRPVLEPAIEDKKEFIGRRLGAAAKAALDGDAAGTEEELNQAGILGVAAADRWFDNPENGWPENTDSTKKAKGSDKPLVDTNQMRKAITYVLRDKE